MMKRLLIANLCGMAIFTLSASADRNVDETRPLAANGTVKIENVSGTIDVVGWDRAEIRIEGRLEDDVEDMEIQATEDEVEIEIEGPDERNRRVKASAFLTVHVPKGASVEIEGISCPVTVTGLNGRPDAVFEIEGVSGDIVLKDCQGRAHVESVSGRIELSGSFSRVEAETVAASIVIDRVTESVQAESVSGKIEIHAGKPSSIEMESLSGSAVYTGGLAAGGRIDAEVFSAGVTLNLTEDVFGRYDISTFSGGIESDFGGSPVRTSRFGPGSELRFTHGQGDARVTLQSFSGHVKINRTNN